MKWPLLFLLPLLAACAAPVDEPASLRSYRDKSVPISSVALFDLARFSGSWNEVARYPSAFQTGCGRGSWKLSGPADALRLSVNCPRDDGALVPVLGAGRMVAPGRIEVQIGGGSLILWVLWVDEGYRTAVIGTPDGTMGWILDRDVRIPRDRLKAAREILDFNGYDLRTLDEEV